jgi:hypothetical protein
LVLHMVGSVKVWHSIVAHWGMDVVIVLVSERRRVRVVHIVLEVSVLAVLESSHGGVQLVSQTELTVVGVHVVRVLHSVEVGVLVMVEGLVVGLNVIRAVVTHVGFLHRLVMHGHGFFPEV